MGFMDKVKETANKAADTAKQATAAGKDTYEDLRALKKIEDIHQEIGALVVAQRRGEAPDADAQIDAKIAEITQIEKEAAEDDKSGGDAAAAS
jgi:hypothetical protein